MTLKKPATNKDRLGYVLFALFVLAYTASAFYLFYNQCVRPNNLFLSDMEAYMDNAIGLEGENPFPYRLYFITITFLHQLVPIEFATAIATTLYNTVNIFVTYYYVKRLNRGCYFNSSTAAQRLSNQDNVLLNTFVTMLVLLCTMIIVPIDALYKYPGQYYIGQYAGNIWHNATSLATRPFATVVFFEFVALLPYYREKIAWKRTAVFSAALFLTTFTKPSFTFVFVPVAGITMLYHLFRDKWKNFKNSLVLGIAFIPTFLLLLYQFFAVFGKPDGGIGLSLGDVWNYYSGHIPFFILLATAFPIWVLVTNFKELKTNKILGMSWALIICGFVQGFFLYEKGYRMLDANFLWGYHHALFYLFFVSITLFISKLKEKKLVYNIIGGLLLAAHFASGVWYYINILQGNKFM